MHIDHRNTTVADVVTGSTTTAIPDTRCACYHNVTPTAESQVEVDAFIYIVVVVVMYATSITFLLIRYGRNYDDDKDFKYHYSEFVKRDKFRDSQYRNKLALEQTKQHLENAKCGSSSASSIDLKQTLKNNGGPPNICPPQRRVSFPCPIITITACSEDSQSSLPGSHTGSSFRIHSLDSELGAVANSSNPVTLLNYPGGPCDPIEMDFLMAPIGIGNKPGEMVLSYDSGVDYLGHNVCVDDIAVCEWIDENSYDERQTFKQLNMKSNSAIAVNHLTVPSFSELQNDAECSKL